MQNTNSILHKKTISPFLYALVTIFIAFSMLFWPQEIYQGASYGLEIWATVLVPSLLPFFILAEVLLNIGIVNMLGILLEPIMRPLFNLPGSASFVATMGFTSGFPMGAVLTKRLVEENKCTLEEGARLVAFTNNSSPLFIMTAIAIGMFNNPALGIILAISHYLANIILGIMLGLNSPRVPALCHIDKHLITNSIFTFLQAHKKRKPLGRLLGDSIKSSINNIFLIGGFVIIFSIIINILKITSLLEFIKYPFHMILSIFGINSCLSSSLASGFWEITLGLKEVSLSSATLQEKAIIASVLLGWSGLSIQAQVASVLAGSDINPHLYHKCRIFQGIIAGGIAYLLSLNVGWLSYTNIPVISTMTNILTATHLVSSSSFFCIFTSNFIYTCKLFYFSFIALLAVSCIALVVNSVLMIRKY